MMVPENAMDTTDSKRQNTLKKWLYVVAMAVVAIVAFVAYSQKERSQDANVVSIQCKPEFHIEDGLKMGLVEINISTSWSILAGKHPKVTFHGFAKSEKEKVKYAQFVFHTQKHPEMSIVDATKRKGSDFFVKIRDFEHGDNGECYFVVATAKQKYVSEPVPFNIP